MGSRQLFLAARVARPDLDGWHADAGVFVQDGPARLVLITCGGDFDYDTRHYLSNVVVTATPSP